jgi:signal transduction histidine kinase
MQSGKAAFPVDWTAIIIRWLFIGGITFWLVFNLGFNWTAGVVALILCLVVGNGIAVGLVSQHRQSGLFHALSVAGDTAFAALLILFSTALTVDLSAAGLLPLISAALYFGWIGALLLTAANGVFQGWLAYSLLSMNDAIFTAALVMVIYLAVGLSIAYATQLLKRPQDGRREPGSVSPSAGSGQGLERERHRAIYHLISSLSSSLQYQRVLEIALDLSVSTLTELNTATDKLKTAVLLFNQEDNAKPELNFAVSRRFLPSDTRCTIPGEGGLIGRAIETAQPHLTRDLKDDPELKIFVALHECQSAYCIPLRAGLDTYGIMLFAHPDPDFFDEEKREILDIVGNQSMIALQNARLYQDLEQEKERMMEIQEEARKKIARDLHDGPTQSIAAIAMRVNFARRLMDRDAKAAAEELFKIEDMARRTTKEIRHMLFTLRPLVLESQGLVAALETMAEKMHETYNQSVTIQADPRVVELLEMGKQAIVFYIAEEAVNNARKHAQAKDIWVRLKLLKNDLCYLEIEDNGVGFDVQSVEASYHDRSSLGMVNMRERAELVNGVLHIDSATDQGTRVQLAIPLSEEAADRLHRVR